MTFALVARLLDVRQPGGLRTLVAAFLLQTALLAGLRIVRRALHEKVLRGNRELCARILPTWRASPIH